MRGTSVSLLQAAAGGTLRSDAALQVSDLDGTMVGEDPAADAGTEAFCNYWEDSAALSGGVLVYNTGRSLGQFKSLWQQKRGLLALPDVLITAVGTKAGLTSMLLECLCLLTILGWHPLHDTRTCSRACPTHNLA